MIGDLHCHTRLSSGSMSIDDLLLYAKRAGLDFIAVTDRDTMEGVTRASVLGKRYGISVIAGVEITCYDSRQQCDVAILCYLPDKPDRLRGLLAQTLDRRNRAAQKMIRAVTHFYPVTEEHIRKNAAGCTSLYTAHIMQALVDLGYDDRLFGKTYTQLFGEGGRCVRAVEYPVVEEVVDLIHSAGGIAILGRPLGAQFSSILQVLGENHCIDGVQLHHPLLTQPEAVQLAEIARQFDLLTIGGSDFDGGYHPNPQPLASAITTEEELNALFAYKQKQKKYAVSS